MSAQPELHENSSVPLFVDLDGTLVNSDLLIESVLGLLKSSFSAALMFPIWLLRGKAHFKSKIAERVALDPARLPYREDFLSFLREEHSKGRPLFLASASNVRLVESVASHLGIFADFLGSDQSTNLSGRAKLAAIKSRVGDEPFDYAANERVDIPIWQAARRAILVNGAASLAERLGRTTSIEHVFPRRATALRAFLRAIRWHQWLKNLLIFVPLVMAHRVMEPALALQALLAFCSFSLAASATYLTNDLLDLDNDRTHPTKRSRPLASGDLPLVSGLLLAPLLLVAAVGIAALLPLEFVLLLVTYIVVTTAYSLRLKRVIALDVLTLAGLYTLRIVAGGAAVQIEPSFWLMGFSMFLFFSLALVKRYSELLLIGDRNKKQETAGRGYRFEDLAVLGQLGTASSLMAVLVLALYINSEHVMQLYSRPQVIWFICPIIMYWLGRIWLLTARGKVDEDPLVFAAKDRRTYVLGALMAVFLWIAS